MLDRMQKGFAIIVLLCCAAELDWLLKRRRRG